MRSAHSAAERITGIIQVEFRKKAFSVRSSHAVSFKTGTHIYIYIYPPTKKNSGKVFNIFFIFAFWGLHSTSTPRLEQNGEAWILHARNSFTSISQRRTWLGRGYSTGGELAEYYSHCLVENSTNLRGFRITDPLSARWQVSLGFTFPAYFAFSSGSWPDRYSNDELWV